MPGKHTKKREYPLKSCGNRHSCCSICKPDFQRSYTEAGRAGLSLSRKGRAKSPEHAKTLGDAQRGRPPTPEHLANMRAASAKPENRAKISAGRKVHIEAQVDGCACGACKSYRGPTRIENILVERVLGEFPEVIREQRFGRWRVDAYLPAPYHLAFEADGDYWHSLRPEKDAEKDRDLLVGFKLPVVRLSEAELRTV